MPNAESDEEIVFDNHAENGRPTEHTNGHNGHNGHTNGLTSGDSKKNGVVRFWKHSTSQDDEPHLNDGSTRPRSASMAESAITNTRSMPGTVIKLSSPEDHRKRMSIWSGSDKVPTREPPASRDDPLYDPACDPENPKVVTFQDISAAQFKIRGGIQYTDCSVSSEWYDNINK